MADSDLRKQDEKEQGKSKVAVAVFCITAGARETWIDQSGFSRRENFTVLTSMKANRRATEVTFLTGDCINYSQKAIYDSKDHIRL